MGKGRRFLEQMVLDTDIGADTILFQPIVEISGDRRVLIENHYGVKAYSHETIIVKVNYGYVCVRGCALELRRMTKDQLVIHGKIDGVTLQRGR